MLVMPAGAKRISSSATGFYKNVFPVLWFGILLAVLALMTFVGSRAQGGVPLVAFLVPVLMMGLGYFLFRKLLSDLMDEVWDNGHELIVVNDGHVEHLPLSNIMNVGYMGFSNPKRVTLSLRQAGRWGARLTFSPPLNFTFAYLTEHPLVEDLIRRADAARRPT